MPLSSGYTDQVIGEFTGAVSRSFDSPPVRDGLRRIEDLLAGETGRLLSEKGDAVIHIRLSLPEGPLDLAVKSFGTQPAWKDWGDHRRGSKARRSWAAAEAMAKRGVGTPEPVAFLEKWSGRRLRRSFYLSRYDAGWTSFRHELLRLYREDPLCWKLMNLLQSVADGVRRLHDAGFLHGDLGNQNILLRRDGEGHWTDVRFIDLNRVGSQPAALSPVQRARDVSRIFLPSDLLRIFTEMCFAGPPPAAFARAERWYRRWYAWHSATRRLRHPIRSRRRERQSDPSLRYPAAREIWIWDDRSAQAISTIRRRERRHLRSGRDDLRIAAACAISAPAVWNRYRYLLAQSFRQSVRMEGRVGISIDPHPGTIARELEYLRALGRLPVHARLYRHQGPESWEFTGRVLRDLHGEGYPVAVSLVQDRRAVTELSLWREFVERALSGLQGVVEWVQVGHAFNRVKWGIWTLEEYRRLVDVTRDVAAGWSGLRLVGPAAIDFEYHYLAGALRNLPAGFRFDGLAHLLYVDRRGAPENTQGGFSALEKFALARAIAQVSPFCADRLLVTEVNWPLREGGIHSPIGSPYLYPGQEIAAPPSVSESEYARYMIRYLLIALCSGLVDRVYWWRLVSRGFGLVDDTDPDHWRARPAYHALRQFLRVVGQGAYVRKRAAGGGVEAYGFHDATGAETVVLYSIRDLPVPVYLDGKRREDMQGRVLPDPDRPLSVDGDPVYVG